MTKITEICNFCGKSFQKYPSKLTSLTPCCSRECRGKFVTQMASVDVECHNCHKIFKALKRRLKERVNCNRFCSKSCTVKYTNSHKTHGTSRSKCEIWLESQLILLYPNIEFKFNEVSALGMELDIYIPSLNIAIEINGPTHYFPIYGEKTLQRTQNKDKQKIQECLNRKIKLEVINACELTGTFQPKKAQKILDIVKNLIDSL